MTAKFHVKINKAAFKEWMSVTLSVTETDALLQKMDCCN